MRKFVLAALLLAAASAANAATLRETVDRTFDVRPGATVSLTNVNGAITVNSWDQPRVHVKAVKTVDRGDESEAKSMLAAIHVDIEQSAGGLSIRTREPNESGGGSLWDLLFHGSLHNTSVVYEVTVPRSMNLHVDDTNGAVIVSGVSGALHVETTNGHIELHRCGGSVDLNTTNGRIEAELLQLDRSHQQSVETTNGRIALTLPPNASASVDAETTNGHISSDLPVTTSSIDRNSLRGTINGGGASVKLRTTNGSIEIHSTAATR